MKRRPHPLADMAALPSTRAATLLAGAVPDHSYPERTNAPKHEGRFSARMTVASKEML